MEDDFLSRLACPQCLGPLEVEGPQGGLGSPSGLVCDPEGLRFPVRDGIPLLVRPDREAEVDAFSRAYGEVWRREGWGSSDPSYLLGLPERDITGRQTGKWRVKFRSLRALVAFLEDVGAEIVADLGAGMGWLSHHLARRGYRVYAVDVLLDRNVGLGAAQAYEDRGPFFQRVQGELQHPPLRRRSVDVVICNASLHYAPNLAEALDGIQGILAEGGWLVVMNSPVHEDVESARRAERDARARLGRNGAPKVVTHRYCHFVRRNLVQLLEEEVGPVREVPFDPGLGFRLLRGLKGFLLGMELASFPILAVSKTIEND